MSDKPDDAPKARGQPSRPKRRRAELAREMRELYQKYGEGEVPQHLHDLADRIGKAYAAAHPASVERPPPPAAPAAAKKRATKAPKKRRGVSVSGSD